MQPCLTQRYSVESKKKNARNRKKEEKLEGRDNGNLTLIKVYVKTSTINN